MQLDEFLGRNETVLWTGAPPKGLMLRRSDIFFIPFSFVWGGLAILWTLMVVVFRAPSIGAPDLSSFDPFLIIGLLLSCFGLYLMLGRFFHDMARRASTRYAVTSSRAVILSGFFRKKIDFMPLTPDLRIAVYGDKRGSIEFGPGNNGYFSNWSVAFGPSHPFMFERINDVREVYGLVLRVQQGAA